MTVHALRPFRWLPDLVLAWDDVAGTISIPEFGGYGLQSWAERIEMEGNDDHTIRAILAFFDSPSHTIPSRGWRYRLPDVRRDAGDFLRLFWPHVREIPAGALPESLRGVERTPPTAMPLRAGRIA